MDKLFIALVTPFIEDGRVPAGVTDIAIIGNKHLEISDRIQERYTTEDHSVCNLLRETLLGSAPPMVFKKPEERMGDAISRMCHICLRSDKIYIIYNTHFQSCILTSIQMDICQKAGKEIFLVHKGVKGGVMLPITSVADASGELTLTRPFHANAKFSSPYKFMA